MTSVSVTPRHANGIVGSMEQLQCLLRSPQAAQLRKLVVKEINLSELTEPLVFPANIQHLTMQGCQISVFPTLQEGLQELKLDGNRLTELGPLPRSLRKLFCRNNQLSYLPELHEGLVTLAVSNDQLQDTADRPAIRTLPNSLVYLELSHNALTRIPELPSSLRVLLVNHNQLQHLPALPEGLHKCFAHNNQLTSIPLLHNLESGDFSFGENPLEEPYRTLYDTFIADRGQAEFEDRPAVTAAFKNGLLAQVEDLKRRGRELAEAERFQRGTVEVAPGRTVELPQGNGPINLIGRFLSGQKGSTTQQKGTLKQLARGGRRTKRKGRKDKKRYTR